MNTVIVWPPTHTRLEAMRACTAGDHHWWGASYSAREIVYRCVFCAATKTLTGPTEGAQDA